MYKDDNLTLYSLSRLVLGRFAAVDSEYDLLSVLQCIAVIKCSLEAFFGCGHLVLAFCAVVLYYFVFNLYILPFGVINDRLIDLLKATFNYCQCY